MKPPTAERRNKLTNKVGKGGEVHLETQVTERTREGLTKKEKGILDPSRLPRFLQGKGDSTPISARRQILQALLSCFPPSLCSLGKGQGARVEKLRPEHLQRDLICA